MEEDHKPAIREKVELHVHLDGAIRAETVLDLARSRKIALGADTIDDLKKRIVIKKNDGLQKLLESFAIFTPTLAGDREAIKRVAYEFCEDCAKHGVIYSEARFSPHILANDSPDPYHAHVQGDLSASEVVKICTETFEQGSYDFKIKVNAILCCILGKPEWSAETVSLCEEFRDRGVVGIDLASGEYNDHLGAEYLSHVDAFHKAYQLGIHRTVHAGEVTGPKSVKTAVDLLRAERIGHGYHVLDDPDIYKEIREKNIHLESCVTSPILTAAIPEAASDITKHAILRFARDGVNFSINSDDPLPMDIDISAEYEFALNTMGLSDNQLIKCIFNAAESSFTSPNDKRDLIQRLEGVYGKRRP